MAVKLPSFLLLCPLFDFDEGTSRKVFGRSAEGKLGRRPAFLSARLCTSQVMCCFCSAVRKSQNWSICISSGFFRLSRAAASPYFAVSCSWTRSSSACFGSIFRKFAMSRRSRFDGSWIPPTAFRTVSYPRPLRQRVGGCSHLVRSSWHGAAFRVATLDGSLPPREHIQQNLLYGSWSIRTGITFKPDRSYWRRNDSAC